MAYGHHSGKGIPPSTDIYGLWSGVVEDIKDPEKRGRVRVRVFDLHDEDTPIEELPWALPCFPNAFCKHDNTRIDPDARDNGGFFHVPPEDSLVHIMFRQGNTDRPVWMGGWFPAPDGIQNMEGYRNRQATRRLYNGEGIPSCPTWGTVRGFRIELDDENREIRVCTPKGHKITMSDSGVNDPTADGIRIEDHKGNYIWMDTGNELMSIYWNGNVEEHITGDLHRTVGGDMVTHVEGSVHEHYEGDLHSLQDGTRNVDAATIYHNTGTAQPDAPNLPDPGEASGGDRVRQALRRLGNQIRRIVTRG